VLVNSPRLYPYPPSPPQDYRPRRRQTLTRLPSKASEGIDRLDNEQRLAVMRAVADGALPESEALRLMEAYLQIEHGIRDARAAADGREEAGAEGTAGGEGDTSQRVRGVEVIEGKGLSLTPDGAGRLASTLASLSIHRRGARGAEQDGADIGKGIDGRHYSSPADTFYKSVSQLDDLQRMAVLEAVKSGSLTQDEALALVKSFLAETTYKDSEFEREATEAAVGQQPPRQSGPAHDAAGSTKAPASPGTTQDDLPEAAPSAAGPQRMPQAAPVVANFAEFDRPEIQEKLGGGSPAAQRRPVPEKKKELDTSNPFATFS